MTPMEEYLQFLTLQGEQPGSASYEEGKKLSETLGGATPQYTGAKDYSPLEQFLTQKFGSLGEVSKFVPPDEGGGYFRYEAPAHLRYNPSMGFGGVSDRNNPIGISSITPTGFAESTRLNEYGGSEPTEGAPTGYTAALTNPYYRDGVRGQYAAQYDDKGKMIGNPYWMEMPNQETSFDRFLEKYGLALPLLMVAPYAIPEILAASGVGVGTTAATLGELGINTALAAGELGGVAAGTMAGDALTTFNLGQTLLPDAPSAVQQGLNRFAVGTITSGGDPRAGAMNAFTGGLSDLGNVAFADVPSAIRAPIVNVATQVAQGKDIETAIANAATNAAVGGLSSVSNAALGEVPSAIREPITNVVSQLAQGKDAETAIKNTVAGSLSSIAGSEVKDFTDSKFVSDLASNAVRQLVSTGEVDPTKLSGAAINQLSNTIVDSIVGPPSRRGGLNQTKGKKDSQESFGSDFLKSAITGALASAAQSARAPQTTTSRTSSSQARTRAPIQVDVSLLQPIVRQQSQSGPPLRVDVSTLTPINRATNLSAIVGNTGKSG